MASSEPTTHARPCAVTGAGGFIGSHLVEVLLAQGRRVRALVRYNGLDRRGHLEQIERLGRERGADWWRDERLEVIAGDVQDARCVRELVRGCETVFHLAALIGIPYSYAAPQSYVGVNILGTLNVLEAARDEGVGRVLTTSTSETYGTAQRLPIDETHPLQAQSPYAATKIAADKLAESYHRSFGLPVVTVRPFNVFGPRQSARAVLPTILIQALARECEAVHLGALDPVRDWTYVEDTVAAFTALADAPAEKVIGGVFNVGVGEGRSIGDAARLALELIGVHKPILSEPRRERPEASEVQRLVADATRLREAVGWRPRVDFEDGLRRTIDWLRRHLPSYRPGDYTR